MDKEEFKQPEAAALYGPTIDATLGETGYGPEALPAILAAIEAGYTPREIIGAYTAYETGTVVINFETDQISYPSQGTGQRVALSWSQAFLKFS